MMEGDSKALSVALSSAALNIVLQVSVRILTFILNGLVIRYISKEALGVANVRLALFYTTVLFLSHEAFRKACLSSQTSGKWQQVINILWLSVPLSVVCSIIIGWVWIHLLEAPGPEITTDYGLCVILIAVSTVIEKLSEPLYVTSQAFHFVRLRVMITGLSFLVKSMSFLLFVIWRPEAAVWHYAISQLLFSLLYSLLHYLYFTWYLWWRQQSPSLSDLFPVHSIWGFMPQKIPGLPVFDAELLKLTWSFMRQGLLKQFLTEGERYVMTLLPLLTFGEQGVYDVVNNIGSMAARYVFQPVEEAAYLFFVQTLDRERREEKFNEAQQVLQALVKLMLIFGLTVVCFGQAYSHLFLHLYGGTTLSSGIGPTLLQAHCLYVLFLALNGITEAFAFATMTRKEIDLYNLKLAWFSLLFIILSWLFTHFLGPVGFILANCANMVARILHSVFFIMKLHSSTKEGFSAKPYLPGFPVGCILGLSLVITLISSHVVYPGSSVLHLTVGAGCSLVSVAVIVFF